MQQKHGHVLWVVLIINAVMFLVEGVAGLAAHPTSLLADALDMLGDALVYRFSLFVLARSPCWQAGAALALGANLVCFFLLYRHGRDNLNMRSTWLRSRNDLMANAGVLVAAVGSYLLTSRWPDMLGGVFIASLFLGSALHVLRQSRQALRAPRAAVHHSVESMTLELPQAKL